MLKNEAFSIAGVSIQPGEYRTIELPAASLYTQTAINIPIHVMHGKRAGPRIFITSAIHGDEMNSVEIARRLITFMSSKHLHGTLIIIPIANIYGFITLSRYLPDRHDLNRSFPGSKTGSLASRLANLFMEEIITKCTHGIDLHTGRVHLENFPQIRTNIDTPGALEMAKAFNVPVILDAKLRDGSLRQACAELNIPVLVYEGAEALRFDELATRAAVKGVINVLRYFKMIPASHHLRKHPPLKTTVALSSMWLRAPESGIVKHIKQLGSEIKKGDVVGIIANPFTQKEYKILADVDGIIIGWTKLPCVNEGDALFHIASFEKTEHVTEQLDRLMVSINLEDQLKNSN